MVRPMPSPPCERSKLRLDCTNSSKMWGSSSGSIPEDVVQVDFVARLKSSGDITTPTLQEIIVNRYEVTYTRTDGGTAVPAGFQRAMNATAASTKASVAMRPRSREASAGSISNKTGFSPMR